MGIRYIMDTCFVIYTM